MDSEKLRRSTTGAAARILLANAADGVATKAPAKSVAAQVKAQAIVSFSKLDPADQDDSGLIRAVDEVCHGRVLGPRLRGPAPFLGSCPSSLPSDGEYSTVIAGPSLQYVVDRADLDRLFGATGATQLSTAGIDPKGLAAKRLADTSSAAAARRRVRIGPGQRLGGVVLWLTRRTLVDQLISHAAASGAVPAELLTDALGLYYPQYNPVAPASNHRYVLHIPATVVSRRPAFQPTFIEASDYPRFKAKPTPGPAAKGWGKTLDLGRLAEGHGLNDGLDEVTTWPLDEAAFEGGESMELQYLGAITRPRGLNAGVDDHQSVANLLMNGRRVSSLLKAAR